MNNVNYKQAAIELLSRRVAGTKAPCLPKELRPVNMEDALQIQAATISIHNEEVVAWKCLLPLSDEKFVLAPIFSGGLQKGEVCELFADNDVARIEPEIAFVLSKDLPANPKGYTEAQINAAIGSCHMALELIQVRHADDSGVDHNEKLADCLVNQGLYLGPEIDREKAFTAANINISITQGNAVQAFKGEHPNNSPVAPLYWFINYMAIRGVDLQSGVAIITGSYCGLVEAEFERSTTVDYDCLGQYDVTFKAK